MPDDSQPSAVLIAADDLTGANDSAVQFTRSGWSASIALDGVARVPMAPRAAIAVSTDARAMAAAAAANAVRSAIQGAGDAIDRVYLKIDSTMRGSVRDQIEGALAAWSGRDPGAFAVVCPAYPALGRVVHEGRLLVDGEGVERSAAGNDPVTPVLSNRMLDLVPGARSAAVDEIADAGPGEILLLDAVSDEELGLIASAVDGAGPCVVPVGSAGLAVALARVWAGGSVDEPQAQMPRPHVGGVHLLQVTSLHRASREQADRVAALPGAIVVDLQLDDLTVERASDRLRSAVRDAPDGSIVLFRSPEERDVRAGSSAAQAIAGVLGAASATVVRDGRVARLGLIGGDGARGALNALGVRTLTVTGVLAEGIPLAAADDGDRPSIMVWTKAGGFGGPSALVDIVGSAPTVEQPPRVPRPSASASDAASDGGPTSQESL